MANLWKKAVDALGLRLCSVVPGQQVGGAPPVPPPPPTTTTGDVPVSAAPASSGSDWQALMPASSNSSISSSVSSENTCAICLDSMKPGHGQALFSAECNHTFHFSCIASSVKHGNQVCPVCRAQWKDIPFQGSLAAELPHGGARVNPVNWPQEDIRYSTSFAHLPRSHSSSQQLHNIPPLNTFVPTTFDDDEPLDFQGEAHNDSQHGSTITVTMKTYTEFPAIPRSVSQENYAILIHLKAPTAIQNSRAPVDLVTVLDVSGSMSGTKLALLKRAMGFVIHNLGPSDRLSVVSFSSTARRLFPLCRMTEVGRQHALQAVNSLTAGGGTNIAEGLRISAKVLEECKEKNPVCSIILLSDGHDTYTVPYIGSGSRREQPEHQSRLLSSICVGIPVHAFGFGADHDSALMHSVSEASGGTFSFIEDEGAIQDAFAQCIGGLLSVVVQEMQAALECMHPGVVLISIKSGSYIGRVLDGRTGSIDVGCLYADEERDFLVFVNIQPAELEEMPLLMVGCTYRDPVSKEMVTLAGEEVRVQRPEVVVAQTMSVEVDREKTRILAVEAMVEARATAERGDLSQAVLVLEERRRTLSESLAGRAGDRLAVILDAELKEMQERMASRQRYESSGRAYLLSGLNSHELQRATARGDSMSSTGLAQAYETPSMTEMLHRSQTMLQPVSPTSRTVRPMLQPVSPTSRTVRPMRSFNGRQQPR